MDLVLWSICGGVLGVLWTPILGIACLPGTALLSRSALNPTASVQRFAVALAIAGQALAVVLWTCVVLLAGRHLLPRANVWIFLVAAFFINGLPLALAGESLDHTRVITYRDTVIRKAWIWSSWICLLGFGLLALQALLRGT